MYKYSLTYISLSDIVLLNNEICPQISRTLNIKYTSIKLACLISRVNYKPSNMKIENITCNQVSNVYLIIELEPAQSKRYERPANV